MANSAGARFDALLSLMARLRGEGGCPWDREQTRTSLKPYLIEEAYEVLQAIDEEDTRSPRRGARRSALPGRVPQPGGRRGGRVHDGSDVLERLIEKMTRRHPHVFGDRDGRRRPGRAPPVGADQARRGTPNRCGSLCPRRRPRQPSGAPPRSAPAGEGGPRGIRLALVAGGLGQGARGGGGSGRGARRRGRRTGSGTSSATCCFPWSMWLAS